jgi:tight adherence protein B
VIAVPVGARIQLGMRGGRRRKVFANQLDDTLGLLAGSMRAGHSLLRAVDAVSREAESPTSEEFARIVNETRLGRDLNDALDQAATRMRNEDFGWVGQAIAIHREVGGDLAGVLDEVGHTIRERGQIRRQVSALSAEGKMSAYILLALPFVVLGILFVTSRDYVARFVESPLGYAMIAGAVVLITIGALWLKKIVSFKF